MKNKPNEIKLPTIVKRGRIDLTEFRTVAGLDTPMTPQEKTVYEDRFAITIQEMLSPENVLKTHEESLKLTLEQIKKARKLLSVEKANPGSSS